MNASPRSPRLDGQIALVTGAARGIGQACAVALADAGADLILGLRDASTGGETAERVRRAGRKALPVQMGVSDPEQIQRPVAAGAEHLSRIDILVNNAGIGAPNPADRSARFARRTYSAGPMSE